MNLKSGIGLCLSTLTAVGIFAGAGDTEAANCEGPLVAFTAPSSCGNPTIVLSQGALNAPFPKSLIVQKLSNEEPNARGRGFNAAGEVRCSTKDETVDGQPGPIAGCNSSGVNNTVTQQGRAN
jgi:hypothetical protein